MTTLLKKENHSSVTVGKGWYRSPARLSKSCPGGAGKPAGRLAQLVSSARMIPWYTATDESWTFSESPSSFRDIRRRNL
ncbi:MAG: hypothetical protein ACLTAF_09155 [Blautia coccoides]